MPLYGHGGRFGVPRDNGIQHLLVLGDKDRLKVGPVGQGVLRIQDRRMDSPADGHGQVRQKLVVARSGERDVELRVEGVECFRRKLGSHALLQGDGLGQGSCRPHPCGGSHRGTLERGARLADVGEVDAGQGQVQLEHLPEGLDVRGLHDRAVAWPGHRDEDALCLQHPDRLAHRTPTDVQLRGQFTLRWQPVTAAIGAVEDARPDVLQGHLEPAAISLHRHALLVMTQASAGHLASHRHLRRGLKALTPRQRKLIL